MKCFCCGDVTMPRETPVCGELIYEQCFSCGAEFQVGDDLSRRNNFTEAQRDNYGVDSIFEATFVQWLQDKKAKARVKMLKKLAGGGTLIEAGPGTGALMRHAIDAGFNVTGVEESTRLAETLHEIRGARVVVGEFERVDLGDAMFDVFVSCHVIEHLADPEAHLLRALEFTRPGGFAVVYTPSAESFEHRWTGRFSQNYSSGHLQLFTSEALKRIMAKTGWEPIHQQTVCGIDHWVRACTGVIRGIYRNRGQTLRGGEMVDKASPKLAAACLNVGGFVTRPLRFLQEVLGRGNDLCCIARRAA
jgi:2-polyprenyl-3-methyl-5-hydroxy-6-metoxy-1,4-benzoquinol methylase